MRKVSKVRVLLGALVVLVLAAFAAGCGPDSDQGQARQEATKKIEAKGQQARQKVKKKVEAKKQVDDLQKEVNEGAQALTAKPNIVFILTDDIRKDDLKARYMPQTTTELVAKGMSFQNAFVSNPVCCPSRATIMRGQYSHNTDVWFNNNVFDPDPNIRDGGWKGYNGNGYENENVATRLKAAGYSNRFFGKYLNGYTATTAPTTRPRGGRTGSPLRRVATTTTT